VPGRNRPSLDNPPEELRTFGEGVLAGFGDGSGVKSMVASRSGLSAVPQEEQNRPASETSFPQDMHLTIDLSGTALTCAHSANVSTPAAALYTGFP
jgi:hypothetical protein